MRSKLTLHTFSSEMTQTLIWSGAIMGSVITACYITNMNETLSSNIIFSSIIILTWWRCKCLRTSMQINYISDKSCFDSFINECLDLTESEIAYEHLVLLGLCFGDRFGSSHVIRGSIYDSACLWKKWLLQESSSLSLYKYNEKIKRYVSHELF